MPRHIVLLCFVLFLRGRTIFSTSVSGAEMSVMRNSGLGDFTRGGQVITHYLRMIGQVVQRFIFWMFVVFVSVLVATVYYSTEQYEQYVTVKWITAKGIIYLRRKEDATVSFAMPTGKVLTVNVGSIVRDEYVNNAVHHLYRQTVTGLVYGMLVVLVIAFLLIRYVFRTGQYQREEKFVRGGEIVDGPALKSILKSRRIASDITVAGIPLRKNTETQHILMGGSTGTGKSVAIRELLAQVRKRKQRAIVYDTSGEYVEYFYRPGRDIVLNPLDERCPVWSVWSDGSSPPDFDNIAAALIPDKNVGGDPFWYQAARTLFSNVAFALSKSPHRSTRRLLDDLLTIKMEDAAKIIKGMEGAALLAEGADKLAVSIRATLATYTRSLKYLPEGKEDFSIRKWVDEDKGDGWIFITSRPNQKETLRPLITAWLDIAASSIMSLPRDKDRRIWMVIDELPSLNKLPSLSEMLAQSRKFGGCCTLGFQSYSQMADVYGTRGAEAITGLCSTWLVYRNNDPVNAEWASKSLGSVEMMETSEGLSYGANEIRDGVNLTAARALRTLVIPTEISRLEDLHGFIRLPGDLPIGRFKLDYVERKTIAEGFKPRNIDDSLWVADSNDAAVAPKPEPSPFGSHAVPSNRALDNDALAALDPVFPRSNRSVDFGRKTSSMDELDAATLAALDPVFAKSDAENLQDGKRDTTDTDSNFRTLL